MKRIRRNGLVAAAFVMVGGAGSAWAQIPAIPVGAPAAIPPAAPIAAGPPVVAAPAEIGPGPFQKKFARLGAMRRALCATPLGALLNGMTKPLSSITGGVIPPFCPQVPTDRDAAKPGVAGAANAAKKEAAEAKERQAAVRFLGTLDCRYFPDTPGALAVALRGDSSECVRYEAALVLGRGCCCSQKTVAALEASVAGTDLDGFPAERSIRVRCAAAAALERCLSCYTPPAQEEEPKKVDDMGEKPPIGEKPPTDSPKKEGEIDKKDDTIKIPDVSKLPAAQRLPTRAQAERAARTLAVFQQQLIAAGGVKQTSLVNEEQSVYTIVKSVLAEMGPMTATPSSVSTSTPSATMASIRPMKGNDVFATRMPNTNTRVVTDVPSTLPALVTGDMQLGTTVPVAASTPSMAPPSMPPVMPTMTPPSMPPVMPIMTATPSTAPMMPAFVPPSTPVGSQAGTLAPAVPSGIPASPVAALSSTPPVMPSVQATMPTLPSAPTLVPEATVRPAISVTPQTPTLPSTQKPVSVNETTPSQTTPVSATTTETIKPTMLPSEEVQMLIGKVEVGATSADRHAAIRKLVKHDWRDHPQVVSGLLSAAKGDADRAVRVDGIRHLAAYKVTEPRVLAALTEMTADNDSWIAKEAAEALTELMLETVEK